MEISERQLFTISAGNNSHQVRQLNRMRRFTLHSSRIGIIINFAILYVHFLSVQKFTVLPNAHPIFDSG